VSPFLAVKVYGRLPVEGADVKYSAMVVTEVTRKEA
jgi:hypothetical protein